MSSTTAAARTGSSVSLELTSCPTDIELACFVDGLLDEHAHQAVLRHLDACDDCRDVVATAVEALPDDSASDRGLDPGPLADGPARRPV